MSCVPEADDEDAGIQIKASVGADSNSSDKEEV